MSCKGSEISGKKQKPIGSLDLKLRKRDRSPSDDTIKLKKRKCSELSTRASKPSSSTRDQMKKFLTQASENELDKLTEFLIKRKRKRASNTPLFTEPNLDVEEKVSQPAGEKQPWRREVSHEGVPEALTQTIVRKITASDLSRAHAELFPEDELENQNKKLKLTER